MRLMFRILKHLKRNEKAKFDGMGRLEYFVGMSVGDLLVWCGKMAARRGDLHESNHILAALVAGTSDHPGECTIPRHRLMTYGDRFECEVFPPRAHAPTRDA